MNDCKKERSMGDEGEGEERSMKRSEKKKVGKCKRGKKERKKAIEGVEERKRELRRE